MAALPLNTGPMDSGYFEQKTAEIAGYVNGFLAEGLKPFVSSSFQSHSIPLLHILTSISKEVPVYFIDTGFHFPETIVYRDQIAELLGIEVINTKPMVGKNLQQILAPAGKTSSPRATQEGTDNPVLAAMRGVVQLDLNCEGRELRISVLESEPVPAA